MHQFYLCKELGQLWTCLSKEASFVAVVTVKPIVFGGLWLGGNSVEFSSGFVVGLFSDDVPKLCAAGTRFALGGLSLDDDAVGTSGEVIFGELLGISVLVPDAFVFVGGGETDSGFLGTLWILFTVPVFFGTVVSDESAGVVTGDVVVVLNTLLFGVGTFFLFWTSGFGEGLLGATTKDTEEPTTGVLMLFLFSILMIFGVCWRLCGDLEVTVDFSFSPLFCNLTEFC